MTYHMNVIIPEPKYPVGSIAIALVNHQLRYIEVIQAYMSANFVLDADGVVIMDGAVWEYDGLVMFDPVEQSERMIIAESTVIVEVDS